MRTTARRSRRIVAATALAMALSYQVAFPSRSLAAATTNCSEGPGAVNHWRGQALNGGQKHGASGTVSGRVLVMCTSPGAVEVDGSFYFSNVEPNSGTFRDIVQIGFGQGRSPSLLGGMYYVYGWGRSTATAGCSGFVNKDPLATQKSPYVNAVHDFKVRHASNAWRLYVDATQQVAITESAICWTGGRATWFGETWDAGDQMGGTDGSRMSVGSMNYSNTEDGGFVWTNLDAAQACNYSAAAPAAYRCDITGTRTIQVWTLDR